MTAQIPLPIERLAEDECFDVVVIGAGGAGMAAALFDAIEGGRVLLVEATEFVGGTTAYAGGTNWVPGNHHGAAVNPDDTLAQASLYLDRTVGNHSDRAQRAALIENSAPAVRHIEANSHVRYRAKRFQPDYVSEAEGSTVAGRAIDPVPFDGRKLGRLFPLLRPPIASYTVLGGMMVDFDDVPHLLGWYRSPKSFAYTARLVLRHALDRLRFRRGTRLVMGNALVGRLLLSLKDRSVPVMLRTEVTALERHGDGIDSLTLSQDGQSRRIRVRGGVVLATGGFNRHPARRARHVPGIDAAWSPSSPGNTGRMHDLAEAVGARYGTGALTDLFWTPVSLRPQPDGSTRVYPHFSRDRSKPRMVTVNSAGQRFTNEAASWHEFGRAMVESGAERGCIPALLITDAIGMRRYGLGTVRPGTAGLRAALADGYVTKGETLEQLAQALGIDAAELAETVRKLNTYAETGIDPEFGRGSTEYERAFGDPAWPGKNPTLGPIDTPPFYAVRIYPGDIGAATGFVTDQYARAMDAADQPIPGLYVCGNDMQSVVGGVYAGPGVTIGPGMVFAFLGARHAMDRARASGAIRHDCSSSGQRPPVCRAPGRKTLG